MPTKKEVQELETTIQDLVSTSTFLLEVTNRRTWWTRGFTSISSKKVNEQFDLCWTGLNASVHQAKEAMKKRRETSQITVTKSLT